MSQILFAVIFIETFVLSSVCFGYSGGLGTPQDPYQIATKADLLTLAATTTDYNKCFILTADINLAGQTYSNCLIAPDINKSNYVYDGKAFTGVFDGNDHIISNFTCNTTDTDYIGIFGYIDDADAIIKDLTLINPDVNATGNSHWVGPLVGYLKNGTIIGCAVEGGSISVYPQFAGGVIGFNEKGFILNCHAIVAVSANWAAGGLVGYNYLDGHIENCYATGPVDGYIYVGGLAGYNQSGTITDCYSTGSVNATRSVGGLVGSNYEGTIANSNSAGSVSGYDYTGGLVGSNYEGTISVCYASGTVDGNNYTGGLVGYKQYGSVGDCYSTGSVSGTSYVGGLLGIGSSISNCYSTSSVIGTTYVGGLVGSGSRISNCYSTGNVNGAPDSNYVGGLAGSGSLISSCYSAGAVSGMSNVGGLVGISYDSVTNCYFLDTSGPDNGYGEPLTDEQMKQQASFIDWDFIEIWNIGENQTYPFLRVYLPSDVDMDGQTNFYDFAVLASHWLK